MIIHLHPTSYEELNTVLEELVTSVQAVLGGSFVGAYLQGSFAIGDYDEHSDVDFIIAIADELSDDHVTALQALHERVYALDSEWAKHLEGSYFPLAILGDHEACDRDLWYLDHGSRRLVRSDHCNTLVVRTVLREHGIALAGPKSTTVLSPIPVVALRREIRDVIRDWGEEILRGPDLYRNRFYQGFIVLSYCRMLHDFTMGRPGSKRSGAAWAKANLDAQWSPLIERAWVTRPNPAVSVRQPANAADFASTLEFIKLIMQETERRASELV